MLCVISAWAYVIRQVVNSVFVNSVFSSNLTGVSFITYLFAPAEGQTKVIIKDQQKQLHQTMEP
jgi:hypothetical protein